ncbi:hypothetical protein LCGC14_3077210, partial [marine sediment metagenome]
MSNYFALSQPRIKQRLPLILGNIFILVVLLGTTTGNMHPWAANINRLVGIALVLFYLACHVGYRLKTPVEIILFGVFIGWASVSGMAVSEDGDACMMYVRFLAQLWVLLLAVAGFSYAARSPAGPLLALLGFACFSATMNLTTGSYALGFGTDVRSRGQFGWNPNSFGFLMLLGIMALTYLWRYRRSLRFRILRLAIPPLAAMLAFNLLSTASRKSFAVLLLFGVLYLWFCYKHEVLRNLWAIV